MALRHELVLTTACRGLGMVLGFAMAVITVRALGADGRGRYFLLVTTALLVAQVGTLGLHATLPYEAARAPDEEGRLAEDAWWVSAGLGSLLAALLFAGGRWLEMVPEVGALAIGAAALLGPVTLFQILGGNLLVGLGRVTAYNVADVVGRLTGLASMLVALRLGASIESLTVATLLGAVVSAGLIAAPLGVVWPRRGPNWTSLRERLRLGWRAYALAFLGFAVLRTGAYELAAVVPAAEVGRFSVAGQIGDALVLIPASILMVVFPRLVSRRESMWTLSRAVAGMAVLMGTLCAGVGAVGAGVLAAFFGSEMVPAAPALRVYLLAMFFSSLVSVVSHFANARGFPRWVIGLWGGAAVLVAVLGWLLVPWGGSVGAAWALAAGYGTLFVALLSCESYGERLHRSRAARGRPER
jgi:O-antigen/teichoic acid export membrane protein